MPTTSYHRETGKPTMLLALIAALVVSAYNRSWLSRPVCELAAGSELSLERLSRLKARLLVPMEALIARATRRGRHPVETDEKGLPLNDSIRGLSPGASIRGREEAQWEEERGKRDFLRKHPELLLKEGLDLLSFQWDDRGKYLIANGAGHCHAMGRMMVREAAGILSQRNPWTYQDDIHAILNNWAENHREIDPLGVRAIIKLVHKVVEEQVERIGTPSREDTIRAITREYEPAPLSCP